MSTSHKRSIIRVPANEPLLRQSRQPRPRKRIGATPAATVFSGASVESIVLVVLAASMTLTSIGLFGPVIVTNERQTSDITSIDMTCMRLMGNVTVLDSEVALLEEGAGTDPVLNQTVGELQDYYDVTEGNAQMLLQDVEMAIMNADMREIIRLPPNPAINNEMTVAGPGTWIFGQYWVVTNCFCNNMRVETRIEGFDPDTMAVVLPLRTIGLEVPKGILATIERTVMSEPIFLSNNQTLIVFDNLGGTNRAIGGTSYFFAVRVS